MSSSDSDGSWGAVGDVDAEDAGGGGGGGAAGSGAAATLVATVEYEYGAEDSGPGPSPRSGVPARVPRPRRVPPPGSGGWPTVVLLPGEGLQVVNPGNQLPPLRLGMVR
jgi:hypothetical protein